MHYDKQIQQNVYEKMYDAMQALGYNPEREIESSISFNYKDSKYVFVMFEDRMEFMEPYWAGFSMEDPSTGALLDVVNRANQNHYGDIFVKTMKCDKNIILSSVFTLTEIPDDYQRIIGHCVLGFVITKDWVISHYLCEINNHNW